MSGDLYDQQGVVVEEIAHDLNESELYYIREHYNPLQRSDCNGADIYIRLKEYTATL